jgi:hypothetical protein
LPLVHELVLNLCHEKGPAPVTELFYSAESFARIRSINANINDMVKLTGDFGLIAGGSKGVGYAIAEALARRDYNLILVAKRSIS